MNREVYLNPHVYMNPWIVREYERLRRKGWTASEALRSARVQVAFADEPNVKLEEEPDCDISFEDIVGDDFDVPEPLRSQYRKELRERIARDGVWAVVTYFRTDEDAEWQVADSCGGFVGDDWKDSGYDVDLMRAALDALAKARDAQAEEQMRELCGRATYAGVYP